MATPNLFESLFEFHSRADHTPKENFLTEALAYVLRTDKKVCCRWLSVLLSKKIDSATYHIVTRAKEEDDESHTPIYPDMQIEGELPDGERFVIICEHKWDSDCNQQQLEKYKRLAEKKGAHARLVFVAANHAQQSEALKSLPLKHCFLWEDAYNALNGVSEKSGLLAELLQFMKSKGLSPSEPLTTMQMRAFLQAGNFLSLLGVLANKLNSEFSWNAIPKRFKANRYVHDAYGRWGIRFETKDWKPAMTVGFLYDETDHKVTFVDSEKGIDLVLRIEAVPKDTKKAQPALDVLNKKRNALNAVAASVLLKGERGNGNSHSFLIVRDCLADVIEDGHSSSDQLQAIYKKLTTWLEILFKDGKLEAALKKSGLDSGM